MRAIVVAVISGALVAAMAGPVVAAKPSRSCPNEKFTRMDYPTFRALSVSVGVPEALLGAEHLAGWQNIDRSGDGLLCVMDLPDTPGTEGGWIFNVVDNTANR